MRDIRCPEWLNPGSGSGFLQFLWEVLVQTKTHSFLDNAGQRVAFAKKPSVIATGIAMSLMAGQYAYAQEQVEKIEVTGTRIPPKNLESTSPVNIVSSEDVKMEGVRTIESLLNTLPQVMADQGQ